MKLLVLLCLIVGSVCGYPSSGIQTEDPNHGVYVLAPIDHQDELPTNAIEVEPHRLPTENRQDDHILHTKKIIALPVSEVLPETEVLVNHEGKAVIATPAENSNEDLVTAESIVFRPLFAYRRKLAKRRRVYVPNNNRRVYYYPNYYPTSYPKYNQNRVYYHPNYYPTYYPKYKRNRYKDVEFPAIA